eukprot:5160623-Pyramimonas_sp.AAC.1
MGGHVDLESAMHRRWIGDRPPTDNPHVPGKVGAIGPLSAINGRLGVDESLPMPIPPYRCP